MVLLKLLLATVSATTNQQQPANPNGFPPGMLSRTITFLLSSKGRELTISLQRRKSNHPCPLRR